MKQQKHIVPIGMRLAIALLVAGCLLGGCGNTECSKNETETLLVTSDASDSVTETTVPDTTKPPDTTAEPIPLEVIKIYIDQGHNPHSHNTGANGNGLREQDVNYVVGRELAALLAADPRFAVKLSRPTEDTLLGTDNTSSLKARTDEANAWGADYFISLHCNAFTEASAHGTDVFVYSADSEAYALGERILEKLVAGTGFRNRGMKIKPELYVLRHTTMPAVLVEMGFITNPSDAALLASRPDLFAACIRDGILAYLNT